MRTHQKWMGVVVGFALAPAAAAAELAGATGQTAGAMAPEKTLADFQRESGSKPVVAAQKYMAYKQGVLEQAPRPTLLPIRLRQEAPARAGMTLRDFQREWEGTKPVVAIQKYMESRK